MTSLQFLNKQSFQIKDKMTTETDRVVLVEDVCLLVNKILTEIEDSKLSNLGKTIENLKQQYRNLK